jgi:XTP/dITP diphosphohydrolase
LDGRITMIPYHTDRDVMPYERIFVPKNSVHTISALTREQKNKISHRAKAFEKLAVYLKKKIL